MEEQETIEIPTDLLERESLELSNDEDAICLLYTSPSPRDPH